MQVNIEIDGKDLTDCLDFCVEIPFYGETKDQYAKAQKMGIYVTRAVGKSACAGGDIATLSSLTKEGKDASFGKIVISYDDEALIDLQCAVITPLCYSLSDERNMLECSEFLADKISVQTKNRGKISLP